MRERRPASRRAGRARSLLAAGLLAILQAGAPARAAGPDPTALQIQAYDPPRPAPAFSLPDLDGKARGLDDLRGKVVLLFFWATW